VSSMLVATRSGRAVVGGQTHLIIAGETCWDSSSPELHDPAIAALFGRGLTRTNGVATRAPDGELLHRDNSLTEELAIRRRASSGYEITLDQSARDTIRREIHDSFHDFGRRLETGGLLLGWAPNSLDSAVVNVATGPAPDAKYGTGSVNLGRAADMIPESLRDMTWCGDWHIHCDGHGAATPSNKDMAAWAQASRGRPYLGLIVTRDRDGDHGWDWPEVTPFVTFTKGGRLVCERARMVQLKGRTMPRVIPKREQKPDLDSDDAAFNPPPTPTPVSVHGQGRVVRSFTAGGHLFKKGDVVDLSSPLVQEIATEYPADVVARYLQPA
jgi:hypothetical protein